MRYSIVCCTLIAVSLAAAAAAPRPQEVRPLPTAYIIRNDVSVYPEGYQFVYETSDGTARQERGTLKQYAEDKRALEVTGSYQYVTPDGLLHIVTFTADENGYNPKEQIQQGPANNLQIITQ